jgi:hypothetical protein
LSIIDMPDTTIAIGADQSAVVDDYGNVIIRPAK